MSRKNVVILGSTGSIGVNTLKVIEAHADKYRVVGLAAKTNAALLARQARRFRPRAVALFDGLAMNGTAGRARWWSGMDGLCRLATLAEADVVVVALSGACGVLPTYEAIRKGKQIALANKEVLVAAGQVIMTEARKRGVSLLPVDSEHSAIFQCLQGSEPRAVKRVLLTGSGGPFRLRRALKGVTPAEALNHPTWRMGKKISVDSATLMNKGLEMIEAHHLFGLSADQIQVVIHPQSIVHSLVEFQDGSMLAQLGLTDMRLPIQYALSYPERWPTGLRSLDLAEIGQLSFERPDLKRFPCLGLAYEAIRSGGTMPAVLNAANEEAVHAFLAGRIGFTEIPTLVGRVMKAHRPVPRPSLADALKVDEWARQDMGQRMMRRS